MNEIEILKRALAREKLARKEAERILEEKAAELFRANQSLSNINTSLEVELQKRTKNFVEIAKFPDQNPNPVMRFDLDGNCLFNNHAGIEIMEWFKLDPSCLSQFNVILKRSFENNSIVIDQILIGKKIFEFTFTPLRSEKYINCYAIDATSRIQSQSRLKASEEKYRGILENLEMGMLEVDNDGVAIKAYPWFCKLTGYDEAEIIGKKVDLILLDESNRRIMETQKKSREEGVSSVYEIELIKKDKSKLNVLVSGAPFYNEIGEKIGSIGIHWDISEKKKTEEELRKAKNLAEEALRVKQNFLANMSHEIRTPMNAIVGMSNLLSDIIVDEQQIRYNSAIRSSASNLLVIINDILDFSKIEAGKFELEALPFNLSELVMYLSSLFKLRADEKSLQLEIEMNSNSNETFLGDQVRITQVLTNLISNAIKFTDKGLVRVEFDYLNGVLEIIIRDSGKGIHKNRIKQIFESFRQEDEGIARKYGGTGLGLSITKSLVELMEGKIEVKSKVGVGTTFLVKIPLNITKEEPVQITKDDDMFNTGKNLPDLNLNILLVEDNKINAFMATSIVENWKCKVTRVENGVKAINTLKVKEFDVVLMDMQMPVLNGVQATKKIRSELKSSVPIIALTANAVKGEKEKCIQAGMNEYISKPFSPRLLHKIISGIAGKKGTDIQEQGSSNSLNQNLQNPIGENLFQPNRLINLSLGDDSFVDQMLDLFLETCPGYLESMKRHLDAINYKELGKVAHQIKPTIDHISNQEMSKEVRYVESLKASKKVDEERVKTFLKNFEFLIQKVSQYRN